MTDRSSITVVPDPWYKLKQFSSYDRKSDSVNGEGWFANADYTQFIGIESASGRREFILFDSDGPGAVVRWWMTFAGEGSYEGIIRVYIDDASSPVIEGNVLDVLSGQLLAGEPLSASVSPETDLNRRGHNLYLPLPYSKHCMITYECDSVKITSERRTPSIYYNICYRQYAEGTKVVSFSKDELAFAKEIIKKTNEELMNPELPESAIDNPIFTAKTISVNDSATINIDKKGAALSGISVKLNADYPESALRSTILKISFDGFRTVWVPAGDFFGTGYKQTQSETWNSSVDDEMNMEAYWLMPFQKKCSVSLINYGEQDVKAEINLMTSDYKWSKNTMYFGASWHEYHQISAGGAESTGGTGIHRDLNFINIYGQGVYAGDAVCVYNTVDAWWGEGDEKIFVDGESFPSSIGTGTEDYYGYAWCRPEIFTHPFIAQPSGSGNFYPGLTINMRYRNLDAIPFNSSISSNIGLWHWLRSVINYGMTTYWYVKSPYKINISNNPDEVRYPLPLNF